MNSNQIMPGASVRLHQTLAACRRTGRTALIPYITAGYPHPEATVPIMQALVAAGADVIELGVPFSDPMADGPVIQQAGEQAIAQGVGLRKVLDLVAEFRRVDAQTPVVLMGYANPVERMGLEAFAARAQEVGVDGVLIVDYPPEAAEHFSRVLADHQMDPIFLLAPTTTPERMAMVGRLARGYVYYVSLKGVTGAGHLDTADVARRVATIRQHVQVPVGVGFGIRDAESACAVGAVADAVVIGSRLIQEIGRAAVGRAANGRAAGEQDAGNQAVNSQAIESTETPQSVADRCARAAGTWLQEIRQALDGDSTA